MIQVARFLRGAPDVHGARHVGTVASEYNTEVADYESTRRNRRLRSAAVGESRPFPGGDDGLKRHLIRARMAGLVLHLRRHLHLANTWTDGLQSCIEQARPQQDRRAQAGNL